ncbi:hypothetical protein [Paraburkholderia sp. JPY419]|uniref:hypothetical protein n=1 Tax=Paraburkholderia sp. JPY419 TaxID=667660 RepID=UPI003D231538
MNDALSSGEAPCRSWLIPVLKAIFPAAGCRKISATMAAVSTANTIIRGSYGSSVEQATQSHISNRVAQIHNLFQQLQYAFVLGDKGDHHPCSVRRPSKPSSFSRRARRRNLRKPRRRPIRRLTCSPSCRIRQRQGSRVKNLGSVAQANAIRGMIPASVQVVHTGTGTDKIVNFTINTSRTHSFTYSVQGVNKGTVTLKPGETGTFVAGLGDIGVRLSPSDANGNTHPDEVLDEDGGAGNPDISKMDGDKEFYGDSEEMTATLSDGQPRWRWRRHQAVYVSDRRRSGHGPRGRYEQYGEYRDVGRSAPRAGYCDRCCRPHAAPIPTGGFHGVQAVRNHERARPDC